MACWRGVGRGLDGDGGPEVGGDANLARLIVAMGAERARDMWAGAVLLGLAHVHAEEERNARRKADEGGPT